MAHIVMADDGIPFDGATAAARPLGGAESAFVQLAEALAARGHRVETRNRCEAPADHGGVAWRRLDDPWPAACDLYIANRGHRLLGRLPGAATTAFWIHNPCRYLLKTRYLWRLALRRPVIVFLGASHAATLPGWVPSGGRQIIPHGVADLFRTLPPRNDPPPPRAVFTSNPLRGLDWLLEVWTTRIHPRMPKAVLDVYSGASVYGGAKAAEMAAVLDRAAALSGRGVRLHAPVGKAPLADVLRDARVMLYRGDENETFCFAVAEAQAVGTPAVACPLGSLPERIADGETGFLAADADAFAERALAVLGDDALWRRLHDGALARRPASGWDAAAAAFESLMERRPRP